MPYVIDNFYSIIINDLWNNFFKNRIVNVVNLKEGENMKIFALTTMMIFMLAPILAMGHKDIKKFNVNIKDSKVVWTGKKVTGQHFGNVNIKSGEVHFSGGKISKGHVIVDMKSIGNTDLKDMKYNKKLVGHLKSPDFFGVDKFAEAKIVLGKTTIMGNDYKTQGDLTIKGITHPIEFTLKKVGKNKYSTSFKFDRSKYDIRYNSGKFFSGLGDKLIYDDVELKVDLLLMN